MKEIPQSKPTSSIAAEGGPSSARMWALRLAPGADVKPELERFVQRHGIRAAGVVSAVGSLSRATLRLAAKKETTALVGPFEIVALSGTLGPDGSHLHIALSDGSGRTIGGHLSEGCAVHTTVEIVLAEMPELTFRRAVDSRTGYRELLIELRDRPSNTGESMRR